jgi:hypothetical protein
MRVSLRALRARIDRLEARLPKPTPPGTLTAAELRLLTDDQLDALIAADEIKIDVGRRRSSEPRSPVNTEQEEDGARGAKMDEKKINGELSDAELSKLSPDQRRALQVADQIMREVEARRNISQP